MNYWDEKLENYTKRLLDIYEAQLRKLELIKKDIKRREKTLKEIRRSKSIHLLKKYLKGWRLP